MYHIGLSSSQAYFPYVAVVINSIINAYSSDENNSHAAESHKPEDFFAFHILSAQAGDEHVSKFKQLESELNKIVPVEIFIHAVDESLLAECSMWRGNYVTYYKTLMGRYLPDDAERMVFIDVDTLVCADIRELFTVDLQGKALAAVYEGQTYELASKNGKNTYSFANFTSYFNAGVLVVDVKKWRQMNAEEQLLRFYKEYTVRCADQDAFNAVFKDNVHLLPSKWNMKLPKSFHPREYGLLAENFAKVSKEQEKWFWEGIEHPAIIHYSVRPWAGDGYYLSKKYKEFYEYPNLDLWWKIAEKTPVFNTELLAIKKSFAYKKRLAKNAVWKFLVKYPFVVKLLKMNDNLQWLVRKIEKPFKLLRNKIRARKIKK